ncbi:SDR family oxidoreductase [uncultured Limosilactobacillus sp.]|uniref:SDR family oxidoreductase n=1 Tax=uncultured Limosilactobacillus sp. TaxID=2837629 RepID=UPI0025E84907|nr:SDR family oxidoreductase [uncultured Limosilactobacillus sp.]
MTKQVLVLGASGHIAHFAIQFLLNDHNVHLTLFSRHPDQLKHFDPKRVTVMNGNTLKPSDLDKAMQNIDIVYANLSNPNIQQQAENIVKAMDNHQIKTLIWISSIGIYNEVPGKFGEWNNQMLRQGGDSSYLGTYRAAADVIEHSNLNYTIIRPAWLTDKDEVDYEITERHEPFKGTEVSRKTIGYVVAKIVQNPAPYAHRSMGIDKPGTDGDKPSWY